MKVSQKLSVSEVYNIISNNIISLGNEIIDLKDSLKRIPSKRIYAKIDNPPFDKSAMDGYGYYDNGNDKFEIMEDVIFAGDCKSDINVPENNCVKIMTGAMIPKSVNKVSKLEAVKIIEENGKNYICIEEKEKSNNIIEKGSDLKANDLLIDIKPLEAEDISVLACGGYSKIEVKKSPKIAIISTGNELIDISKELEFGKIYDSNSHLISNKLKNMNIDYNFYGIIKDDYNILKSTISKALEECDIIIVSGGVSFGDMDYSKKVFDDLKIKKLCHGVLMKPGKPFYFGIKEIDIEENRHKAVFGVPGNPFAVLVSFENFIKPYIYNSMGYKYSNIFFRIPLFETYSRKKSNMEEYMPADFIHNENSSFVKLLSYKGSFYLPRNIKALMKINIGINEIRANENVEVKFI